MSKKYETSFNIFHSKCRKSSRFTAKMSNIFIEIRITKPVMLERSEASQKPRNCHPGCRGGVGPPKKRREITKQENLSC